MMGQYPKYEAYKDSGVAWLGEIPEGWKVQRFRDVCALRKGLNITKKDLGETGIPCLNYGEIHSKYPFELMLDKHPLKRVNLKYLRANTRALVNFGEIIFADTSEDIEGAGNFTMSFTEDTLFAGYHTIICSQYSPVMRHRYFAYFLDSQTFRHQIRSNVKGVKVFSITNQIIKSTNICIPSKNEQAAIERFLDKKTTQIDEAIQIKEKQIELLKERKAIIIQKAVTQGLDPNVPMKDSGVEWIGEIPEHWEIVHLRSCFVPKSIKNCSHLPLLSITREQGIIKRDINNQESNHNFIPDDLSNYKLLKRGQFGINKMKAWQGSYGVSPFTGIVSPAYYVFDFIRNIDICFFNWAIRSKLYVSYFASASDGVRIGQWDLSQVRMKNIPFILASKTEQTEIVRFLSGYTSKTNEIIKLLQTQIQTLKEYKAILINSAVTGKIKITPEMLDE